MLKNKKNKMISPCIISKAKYALDIKPIKPQNSKKCSLNYWSEVLNILAVSSNSKIIIDEQFILKKFEELILMR
ncbi:MAG: hypothetical protein ACOYMA_05590 [Bacteroidia bacterium]